MDAPQEVRVPAHLTLEAITARFPNFLLYSQWLPKTKMVAPTDGGPGPSSGIIKTISFLNKGWNAYSSC